MLQSVHQQLFQNTNNNSPQSKQMNKNFNQQQPVIKQVNNTQSPMSMKFQSPNQIKSNRQSFYQNQ
jgi:hypothetical protein